jgi:hypothetical protein
MMAGLWADIDRDMRLAQHHLGRAVDMLRSDRLDRADPEDDTDEVAFKYRMLAGYTAFESALKRLLLMLDEEAPRGSQRTLTFCVGSDQTSRAVGPPFSTRRFIEPPTSCASSDMSRSTSTMSWTSIARPSWFAMRRCSLPASDRRSPDSAPPSTPTRLKLRRLDERRSSGVGESIG